MAGQLNGILAWMFAYTTSYITLLWCYSVHRARTGTLFYPIEYRDRLRPYHSRDFIEYVVPKIYHYALRGTRANVTLLHAHVRVLLPSKYRWRIARGRPSLRARSKLNLPQTERPVSGVIPQASKRDFRSSCTNTWSIQLLKLIILLHTTYVNRIYQNVNIIHIKLDTRGLLVYLERESDEARCP